MPIRQLHRPSVLALQYRKAVSFNYILAPTLTASMPIVFDNSSNTLLQFAVAPTTIADEGFLTIQWPADLPNPSGLLQCDADGIMRWTSAAGLPPGAVRSYTGAFVGSVAADLAFGLLG